MIYDEFTNDVWCPRCDGRGKLSATNVECPVCRGVKRVPLEEADHIKRVMSGEITLPAARPQTATE